MARFLENISLVTFRCSWLALIASLAGLVGCGTPPSRHAHHPHHPPIPPNSSLPAGWSWPVPVAFGSVQLVVAGSFGILRPINTAQLSQIHKKCAPIQLSPTRWFVRDCSHRKHLTTSAHKKALVVVPTGQEPLQVDFRDLGLDGPIKDQQAAGVCWAFGLSTMMENSLRRQRRSEVIAPLHLVVSQTWDQLWEHGRARPMVTENRWQYDPIKACKLDTNPDNDCKEAYQIRPNTWRQDPVLVSEVEVANRTGQFPIVQFEAFREPFNASTVAQMRALLAQGRSVYVGMKLHSYAWDFEYVRNGVIQDYRGDDEDGHAVALVGYRQSPTGTQFLIHNSWGTDWGDRGYAWIHESTLIRNLYDAFTLEASANKEPTASPPPVVRPGGFWKFPLPIQANRLPPFRFPM
jgi:hypothetical protein